MLGISFHEFRLIRGKYIFSKKVIKLIVFCDVGLFYNSNSGYSVISINVEGVRL